MRDARGKASEWSRGFRQATRPTWAIPTIRSSHRLYLMLEALRASLTQGQGDHHKGDRGKRGKVLGRATKGLEASRRSSDNMSSDSKPSINTKPMLVKFIEHRVHEDITTKANVVTILEDTQDDTARIDDLRKVKETLEAQAREYGIPEANLAKVVAMTPKGKAVVEALEAQSDEMGRRYSRALRILEKRYPKPVLAGLSFRWIEDEASPIGGRLEVGKALSGGRSGPRGFTSEWQGQEWAYLLPKHEAMAHLKVSDDGTATVSIMVKGKAQTYPVTSPSGAAMLLNKAVGLVHDSGKAWAPKLDVWLVLADPKVKEHYDKQIAMGKARADKAKARAEAKAKREAIEARKAKGA